MCTETGSVAKDSSDIGGKSGIIDDVHSSGVSTDGTSGRKCQTFVPIFYIGQWETTKWEKKLRVAILLPTGTAKTTSDHSVRVSEDGNSLKLTFEWPLDMRAPDILHNSWLKSENPELRIEGAVRSAGFRPYLRALRTNEPNQLCHCALYLFQ